MITYDQALERVRAVKVQCLCCKTFNESVRTHFAPSPNELDDGSADDDALAAEENQPAETPPPDDHFIEEELAIAALLLIGWNNAVAQLKAVEKLVNAAKSGHLAEVRTVADELADDFEDTYDTHKLSVPVVAKLNLTFKKGLAVVGAVGALSTLIRSRNRIVSGLENQVRFYMNEYFRRIVHPGLLSELEWHITDLQGSNDLAQVVREYTETHMARTENYWRIVSNQDTSRAHHYGQLRGMEERGYQIYQFVAVVDNRTTAICLSMNGRQFRIADGITNLEATATADPLRARELSPWVTARQVDGRTADDLVALGVIMPPLHANCRSTIVQIS